VRRRSLSFLTRQARLRVRARTRPQLTPSPNFESSEGHTALTAALTQLHAGVKPALVLVVTALLARDCDPSQVCAVAPPV